MTPPDRDPFFADVDAVLEILTELSRREQRHLQLRLWRERHLEAMEHASAQAAHWEATIERLRPFRKEVLQYVVLLLRNRDSQMGRRGQLIFGTVKGSGLMGVALSVVALSALFNMFKSWFPKVDVWWWVGLFAFIAAGVIMLSWSVLSAVHSAGYLMFTAEIVEAAVKMKEAGELKSSSEEGDLTAPQEEVAAALA